MTIPESDHLNQTKDFWFVGTDGTKRGPLSSSEIRLAVKNREVTPDTLAWCSGMSEWKPAAEFLIDSMIIRPPPLPTEPKEVPNPVMVTPSLPQRKSYPKQKQAPFNGKFISTDGRIGRLGFLVRFLITIASITGIAVAARGEFIEAFLLVGFSINIFWVVKRLHDIGRSGQWALILLLPATAIFVVPLLLVIPGQKGANKFGPAPR